ncbi:MAG: hypothetical protein K8W52_07525 [Deltaproteobacteria bacterium]|nr:hypothetical protein [Deltaproteobacteria bacterium]
MRWIVGVGLLVMACGGPGQGATDAAAIDAALVDGAPPDAPFDAAPDASLDATGSCGQDSDCADPHAVCDLTPSPHACVCAAGYAPDLTGACTWSGIIANPGFTSTASWTTAGGTVVDPALDQLGMSDLGAGMFDGDIKAPCPTDIMRIAQTIEMPRRSRAEPLVIEASYRIITEIPDRTMQLGIGTSWHDATASGLYDYTWHTTRACLGAGEYAPETTTGRGGARQFSMVLAPPTLCLITSHFAIDHVQIVPASPGECLTPGVVPNGDAEGSGGWSFDAAAPASAAIVDGVGVGGSRGVQLHLDSRCGYTAAMVPLSIPADLASPAIALSATVATGAALELQIGQAYAQVDGDGQRATVHLCIPSYQRGTLSALRTRVRAAAGTCSDVVNLDAVLDDVAIVDDPACGSDPQLADGGFESMTPLVGTAGVIPDSPLVKVHDASLAHTGSGVLRYTLNTTCGGPRWGLGVIAPAPTGTEGPALAFYYKAEPGSGLSILGFSLSPAYISDGQWHRGISCLDPRLPDIPQWADFRMSDPASAPNCGLPVAETHLYLDDVTLTTDPSCPTHL